MIFNSLGKSDIGRIRAINQDSFLIDEKIGLFVVADGMGGHAGGEIASRLSTEVIKQYLLQHVNILVPNPTMEKQQHHAVVCQHLATAVNQASTIIYEKALEDPALRGMGTTVTLLIIIGNTAYHAHVGDSRLYLLRAGFIFQLTNDHSLVSEQLRAGLITEEEAENHQLKNVITRSVGYQEEEDVDTNYIAIKPEDTFLLCSDGLYGKINDVELSQLLRTPNQAKLNEIIDLANKRGGEDNITGVIVNIASE